MRMSGLSSWIFIIFILSLNIYLNYALLRHKRAVTWTNANKWTKGIIPYYIDKSAFNEEEIFSIQDAINTWNKETCVQFRFRLEEDKNWVKITGGDNCHSYVGMIDKGEQVVNLADPDCRYYGTYLHELGHVIGLHHEHIRPQRHKHLYINKNVIKHGHQKFYHKIDKSEIKHFDTDYDLQSIMHYGPQSFTGTDDKPTINVKDKSQANLLDEIYNKDLSFLDVKVVNLYYKCSKLCRKKTIRCDKGSYLDQFCQCHSPSSFEDRRCFDKIEKDWCQKQKKDGMCELKPAYMSVNCRKTCDKCYKYKSRFLKRKKECKNYEKNSKCEEWSKRGECSQNPGYMKIHCKKSCNLCPKYPGKSQRKKECDNIYDDKSCNQRAAIGDCINNKSFMRINCAKACGNCQSTITKMPCIDTNITCKEWANEDNCKINKMTSQMCRKSCNLCDTNDSECKDLEVTSSCKSRSKLGKCKSNFQYMRNKCRKSCGLCSSEYSNSRISSEKCNKLKLAGDCINKPEYMVVNCHKECWNYTVKIELNGTYICRNLENDTKCDHMRKVGKCQDDVHNMTIKCAKSCKFCGGEKTDRGCRNIEADKNCEIWSKSGNCSKNAPFMMVHCAKTCSRCSVKSYVECKDLYSKGLCRVLKQLGKCFENPSFMLHHCAQSCGSCDLKKKNISNFICSNKLKDQICIMWKTDGECRNNRKFMMENCGKSCGTCQDTNPPIGSNIFSELLCTKWETRGLCKYKFIKNKCLQTCQSSERKRQAGKSVIMCQNIYNDKICANWKVNGECTRNIRLMKTVCEESCNFCAKNISTVNCKNRKDSTVCEKWAKEGKCTKNHVYMLRWCAKSCKNCSMYLQSDSVEENCRNVHDNEICDKWSLAGECKVNPKYMLTNCAKSCGNCKTKSNSIFPNCYNKYKDLDCDIWSKGGECKKNPGYMLLNCARSCGRCETIPNSILPDCQNKHNDKDCNFWSQTGECKKKPRFMLVSCAKSCDSCPYIEEPPKKPSIYTTLPTTVKRNNLTSCENLYHDDQCEKWKASGDCKKNPIFMFSQCRKSCGRCKKFLECQNLHENKVCEKWAKEGICISNLKFMLTLCIKSCGLCSILNFKIETEKLTRFGECRDNYGEITCETWKSIGECRRNPVFMMDQCTKTCGYCIDNSTNSTKSTSKPTKQCRNLYNDKICDEWAENNQCEKNSNFLLSFCAKSCKSCGKFQLQTNSTKSCRNLQGNSICERWAKAGECVKKPIMMKMKCALTCGKCKRPLQVPKKDNNTLSCTNIAGDVQCSYWARQNHCDKNMKYMNEYCQKACNTCPKIVSTIFHKNLYEKVKPICKDKYSSTQCQIWAKRDECDRNAIWMSEYCAYSCSVCHQSKYPTISKKNMQ